MNRLTTIAKGLLILLLAGICSCSQEEGPPIYVNHQLQVLNQPDLLKARIREVNKNIHFTSDDGSKAITYTFTQKHLINPLSVGGTPVQAAHIRYDNDRVFIAYNTAGGNFKGGMEVINFSDPLNPVVAYSAGNSTADYSSVDIWTDPNTATEWALYAGGESSPTGGGAFMHAYQINPAGIHALPPIYRAFDGYCATDISELGIVTGDDGKFFELSPFDFLAPAISYPLTDARGIAYDETTGYYVALLGNPGSLVTGLPNGSIQTIALGGLSYTETKAILRVENGKAYTALGVGGLKVIDLSTGNTISQLPAPTLPAGADPSEYVTNGVSVTIDGLVFIANGAGGVAVAKEDYVTGTLTQLGTLDLDASVNFVEACGNYLFVACGTKGTAIIEVSNLRKFEDPRDGEQYETIIIGDQVWMAENLRYEIPNGSWPYDENPANVAIYGCLYLVTAADTACPAGWHLPSHDEYKTLEQYLGMDAAELDQTFVIRSSGAVGDQLQSTSLWNAPNTNTNSSKFNAIGSGTGDYDPLTFKVSFGFIHEITHLWTSTNSLANPLLRMYRSMNFDSSGVGSANQFTGYELKSVRCIKN